MGLAGHFELKKLHLKNRWNFLKFTLFYDFLQQINNKMSKFKCSFLSPKCPVIPNVYTTCLYFKICESQPQVSWNIYKFDIPHLTSYHFHFQSCCVALKPN